MTGFSIAFILDRIQGYVFVNKNMYDKELKRQASASVNNLTE